jgi:hypothetical protein
MSKADYIWVRRYFSYCPETGEVRWRVAPNNRVKRGTLAGSWATGPHLKVGMQGVQVPIECIVWMWNKGWWPPKPPVHRNGDWTDNRIENLTIS